uniref:TSA: Wollemia nobilis Ref_Wollemi_Transcript_7900_1753 transcribed RNA sequence n=1 Tax=Wollemia nobilis TaxID=56998 RepID=A0A0C9RNN5_9CONI
MAQTVKGQSWLAHFWKSALRAKTYNLDSTTHADNPEGLVRRLGPFDLVLLGIGASVGAGIFVVTGTVAREAGPGVTISFILAGAACVLNALCYAELSSRFPAVVGGAYLYAYSAFNELTAFLVFVQLMLDYHIGAASIARSLASYLVTILQLFPFLKENLPQWLGPGGMECFGGYLSINLLAPVLLALLTLILCQGVRESSAVNAIMTILKVTIVLLVIFAGAFEVDVSNWTPFAPNGFKAIVTGATVVFFAYVGFDAIANSAEECRKPKRDMPIGILVSLIACAALYIGVCLVLTGMLPYQSLGGDAPLAEAFSAKGLKFAVVLISVGAVAGLTTTLLVGLYVQSRLYFGLGRDGLLPSFFGKIHSKLRTPIHSQVWVGSVAGILAGLFNDSALSHILSVGTLEYIEPPGFSCPGAPLIPALSVFVNIFLFAQLHWEAWVRFIVLGIGAVIIYALYGQYHADPDLSTLQDTVLYQRAATSDDEPHILNA